MFIWNVLLKGKGSSESHTCSKSFFLKADPSPPLTGHWPARPWVRGRTPPRPGAWRSGKNSQLGLRSFQKPMQAALLCTCCPPSACPGRRGQMAVMGSALLSGIRCAPAEPCVCCGTESVSGTGMFPQSDGAVGPLAGGALTVLY